MPPTRGRGRDDKKEDEDGGAIVLLDSSDDDDEQHGGAKKASAAARPPPAKRARTRDDNRVPRRVRKVIAESDNDGESDGDDAFMASMDELLKGVDVDPLDID